MAAIGAIAIQQQPSQSEDDDQSSVVSEISSLMMSPSVSATWQLNAAAKHGSSLEEQQKRPPEMIQTSGVDLGVLLSQDAGDHIFTDDEQSVEGSVSPTSSRMSEADFSRVSSLHLGVDGKEEQQIVDEDDLDFEEDRMSQYTEEDWSVHNQQRGREVAKQVLEKARNKGSNHVGGVQKENNSNSKSLTSSASAKKQERPRASKGKKRGIFSKYINKVRRKRRNFLDSFFASKAVCRAVERDDEEGGGMVRPVGSYGSTASAESTESADDDNDDQTASSTQRKPTYKSTWRQDDSMTSHRTAAGSQKEKDIDPTPKINNKRNMGKKIRRFASHSKSLPPKDDESLASTSSRSIRSKHRPSQVVDSILRQFSDPLKPKSVRKSLSGVGSRWHQRHGRSRDEEDDSSSASPEIQKARSSERDPEETMAQLRKMGKDGEKYLEILKREQQAKQIKKQQRKSGKGGSQSQSKRVVVVRKNLLSGENSSSDEESSGLISNLTEDHILPVLDMEPTLTTPSVITVAKPNARAESLEHLHRTRKTSMK